MLRDPPYISIYYVLRMHDIYHIYLLSHNNMTTNVNNYSHDVRIVGRLARKLLITLDELNT